MWQCDLSGLELSITNIYSAVFLRLKNPFYQLSVYLLCIFNIAWLVCPLEGGPIFQGVT